MRYGFDFYEIAFQYLGCVQTYLFGKFADVLLNGFAIFIVRIENRNLFSKLVVLELAADIDNAAVHAGCEVVAGDPVFAVVADVKAE